MAGRGQKSGAGRGLARGRDWAGRGLAPGRNGACFKARLGRGFSAADSRLVGDAEDTAAHGSLDPINRANSNTRLCPGPTW